MLLMLTVFIQTLLVLPEFPYVHLPVPPRSLTGDGTSRLGHDCVRSYEMSLFPLVGN